MMTDEVSGYSPTLYSDANLAHVLKGKAHQHSHFTDVNGKGAVFEGFDFSYCIFTRAYFHKATFSKCDFVGAHFIDCNFRSAKIRDCNFSYSIFTGARIPTKEILENLPPLPNVRRELLQILRRNASSVGDYGSEKVFVIKEIDAKKEHYRRAWRRDEPYYRNKYNPRFRWFLAGLKLLVLKIDSFVWGHGERLWKAPIALTFMLIIFSVALTIVEFSSGGNVTVTDVSNYFSMALVYHMNLFFGLPDGSGIKGVLLIDWFVAAIRFVTLGVIVAALYRRLSHR